MTLCIAAACQEGERPRIVIGADQRIETYMAGADIQGKLYWIDGEQEQDVAVLIAGSVSAAMRLGETYRQYFKKLRDLGRKESEEGKPERDMSPIDTYSTPLTHYKQKLADAYIGREFGMSYKTFMQAIASKQIPDRIAEDALGAVRKLRFECSLILATFKNNEAHIFKVEDDASLEMCEHFATIGAGAMIADGALYQREHAYDTVNLNRAIYHVYEAMSLGRIAPGVSRDVCNIGVLYPPGELESEAAGIVLKELTDSGFDVMQKHFTKYGPRLVPKTPSLPKGSLVEVKEQD